MPGSPEVPFRFCEGDYVGLPDLHGQIKESHDDGDCASPFTHCSDSVPIHFSVQPILMANYEANSGLVGDRFWPKAAPRLVIH
jgi:hypothetical protein